jgi:lysophospholipase L1-like esterase
MRESGIVLDKLVLTPSSSYTPTGTGPPETVGNIAASPPTVTTDAATSITVNSATVNGGVNPNGLATTAWFEWGTDSTLATFSSTSIQSLGSGTSSQPVNAALSGLSAGTPYYFRVAAFNSMGTSKGAIVGFSAASGAASGAFLQDGTGLVSMEAEHYQGNVPRGDYAWALVANPGYSGSGAVQAYPRDEALEPVVAGTGPQMDYQVQFSRTGTHYIWIRALAYSDSTDSAYVGLDGDAAGAAPVTGLNYDGQTWKWTKQTQVGPIAQIYVTSPGLHTINVWMRESGIVLDKLVLTPSSSYTPTGTGPPETVDVEYVAVGDSITFGSNDTISSDGIGYEPILGNLLTVSKGYPVNIANEGVGGVSSADGAAFISATLSKYPSAKYYLVMYGTNDADTSGGPTPSGMNSLPGDPGYDGSYKDNMQKIISAILANGKTPYLAEVPYTTLARYSNSSIQEYNVVIDQLYVANGISVTPPPFYAYFLAHPGELDDGLHPNGAGYQSMADLWFKAIPK